MFFRGRQMLHRDLGYEVLEQIVGSLEDLAKIERSPRMAGRRLTILLIPKKSVPAADKTPHKELGLVKLSYLNYIIKVTLHTVKSPIVGQ